MDGELLLESLTKSLLLSCARESLSLPDTAFSLSTASPMLSPDLACAVSCLCARCQRKDQGIKVSSCCFGKRERKGKKGSISKNRVIDREREADKGVCRCVLC